MLRLNSLWASPHENFCVNKIRNLKLCNLKCSPGVPDAVEISTIFLLSPKSPLELCCCSFSFSVEHSSTEFWDDQYPALWSWGWEAGSVFSSALLTGRRVTFNILGFQSLCFSSLKNLSFTCMLKTALLSEWTPPPASPRTNRSPKASSPRVTCERLRYVQPCFWGWYHLWRRSTCRSLQRA